MRPSVLGTRPEKRLLERSSVCSLGSAPSSGGSRPVMLLFCSSLKNNGRETRQQRGSLTGLSSSLPSPKNHTRQMDG